MSPNPSTQESEHGMPPVAAESEAIRTAKLEVL